MNFNIKSYQGRGIRINPVTRYVCLTDMATASGKQLYGWSRTDKAKSYLETLSAVTQKSVTELLCVGEGNTGTWGHPKVAIRFAQWCSDEFSIQVDSWIDELLTTGKIDLTNNKMPDSPKFASKQIALKQRRIDAREFKVTEAVRLRQEVSLVLDSLVLMKYENNTPLVILIDRWAHKNAALIYKCHRLQIKPMKLDRLGNRHHTPVCVTNKIAMIYGYQPKLYSKANNTRSYQLTAPHESLVCQ